VYEGDARDFGAGDNQVRELAGVSRRFRVEAEMKVAILDDYQNVALTMADWSSVAGRAEITVFNDHVADPQAVIERLMPFDVICVMRERTPLSREIIERLTQLKLIASTARRNASIDMAAA
jgi:hypothetical protein